MTDAENTAPETAQSETDIQPKAGEAQAPAASESSAPAPAESAVPAEAPAPAESAVPAEAPTPAEAPAPAEALEDEEDKPVPYELVSREVKPGSILHLQFRVTYEVFKAKSDEIFDDLRKETIVDGFRKGKAPLGLIRARYSRIVQNDAIETIQRNVLSQFAKQENLMALTEPKFEEIKEVKEGEPMTILVSMEVQPRLEKIEYGDLAVEIEGHETTDEDVAKALEQIRLSHASYEADENAVIGDENGLLLDIIATDDRGREIPQMAQKDFRVVNFREHLPEAVSNALIGKKTGEVAEAPVAHQRKNRAGAILSEHDYYKATIKEVQRRQLPVLDDSLAPECGEFTTLEEVRAEIRKNLTQQEESRRKSEIVRKACDSLLERNPFDVPAALVASSSQRLTREEYYQRMAAGDDPRNWSRDEHDAMARRVADAALPMVKGLILMDEIIRLEKIEVTEEDVEKEIERMAEEQGRRPLALRAQLEKQKKMEDVKESLQTEKARALIISKTAVTIKPEAPAASAVPAPAPAA
ncbi:MAG: trigger factor [Candidatus Sumerlaeota bacterium]|nr:trigger factor [Candidatus Sumerlaeota bacterium]